MASFDKQEHIKIKSWEVVVCGELITVLGMGSDDRMYLWDMNKGLWVFWGT